MIFITKQDKRKNPFGDVFYLGNAFINDTSSSISYYSNSISPANKVISRIAVNPVNIPAF